jgi:hypothetical protein
MDHIDVGDVREFVTFLGETLDVHVLSEGLVGILLEFAVVPRVPRVGEGALEVSHERFDLGF